LENRIPRSKEYRRHSLVSDKTISLRLFDGDIGDDLWRLALDWLRVFVLLLAIYHLSSGWLLHRAANHNRFQSNLFLRVFNESPLLLVLPIIYLVVAKPL
jgi:uncharacterized RDD family membrane protein YckC